MISLFGARAARSPFAWCAASVRDGRAFRTEPWSVLTATVKDS